MSPPPVHPTDDTLAALLGDQEGAEQDVRAHLQVCATCQARMSALRGVATAVAAASEVAAMPSVVPGVLARVQTLEQRRPRGAFLPALAAAAACVVVLVPLASKDEMTARGGAHGTALALVLDGAAAPAVIPRQSTLRADLVHPRTDAALLVVATDAQGHLRWLRPAFTDAKRPPPCPAPLAATALSRGAETVALELPPGPLVVHVLAVPPGCDPAALDAALEGRVDGRGSPSFDGVKDVEVVDALSLTVGP